MARIFWTDSALRYIAEIYAYIAGDSQTNAERFLNRLMDSAEKQLEISAEIGRMTPEFQNPKKRELLYHGYRILYDVDEKGKTAFITQIQYSAKPIA